MPLFEISGSGMVRHSAASLAELGLRERQDLQRLLRDDIGVLDPSLKVISEGFGNWEDARRRIDLLALDKEGRPVKRKAIRTMVSSLIERGCSAAKIAEILGDRKFRGIEGELTDPEEMIAPMEAAYPRFSFDPGRFYVDEPFHQGGRTWLLSKMWGRDTEQMLKDLTTAFSDSGVAYVRAGSS